MLRRLTRSALAAAIATFALLGAAPEPPASPASPVPPERASVTHHVARIGGTSLAYTATAGTLLVDDAHDSHDGPTASMFYVAYTARPNGRPRPLTFLYNGGPGSSSAWLHMLSYGPRRLALANATLGPAAPYDLVDNAESLLDASDLVFVDAVGTGFSRIVGPGKADRYYGVDADARAFANFVRGYVTKNDRWNSPKFLFGESYGTTRSAVLVDRLQNAGMDFRGVVLLSSILNFNTDSTRPSDDLVYPLSLPTQAAVAAYQHALPQQPANLEAFLADVRRFALGAYTTALARGSRLSPTERDAIAATLHADTGLSIAYLERSNLRVSNDRFEKELLRERRRTVGRLDGRYVGIDLDAVADSPDYDPTDPAITGPVTATVNRYVRDELHYATDLDYRTTNYDEINAHWDFRRAPGDGPPSNDPGANVVGDLREAMTKNARLRVFSANGYYDFATPFFATEYTLDHLLLDPALLPNVTYGFYPSGHMVYLDRASRARLKADLARFYDDATR